MAKMMEIELIEGMEDDETKFGKVTYSCPHCHTFLGVGESSPAQGTEKLFGMGMSAMQGG